MFESAQQEAVAAHLCAVLKVETVTISNVRRFHGGASRETYAMDVEADGLRHGLILRCDPEDSLIDTSRELEYAAYRSFEGSEVPVPRAISLCETADIIGTPFFIMERIEGGEAAGPMDAGAYGAHKAEIGHQFFSLLGKVHALDALSSPLAQAVDCPALTKCWERELDYWAGVIAKDQLEPEPIAAAAIRWLRRQPPKPAQKLSIVHGDYRNGNVLHDGAGRIVAVLDWEMAHIGDPLEDLAWAMDPLWNLKDDVKAAGLLPRETAIRIWEDASGCRFDPDAFRWWEMFATLKGLAIWISSARSYADGANTDPILAFSGWYPKVRANHLLATRLSGVTASVRPGAAQVLIGAATTLGSRVIPSLDPKSYAQGDAKMIAALLILLAQDAERATDRLVRENATLRSLFAKAAGLPLSVQTVERLTAAARQMEGSFLLADLQSAHDRLEATLIDLHAEVESVEDAWARSMEAAIWDYLRKSAEDRMLVLPDLA